MHTCEVGGTQSQTNVNLEGGAKISLSITLDKDLSLISQNNALLKLVLKREKQHVEEGAPPSIKSIYPNVSTWNNFNF